MISKKAISIVVPTLNEADNIDLLVRRVNASFKDSDVDYEIIFVDDHSVDNTVKKIEALSEQFPIRLFKKDGERGKAYSLLQGFDNARHNVICMIDADLQYPPEAIIEMYKMIDSHNADMVITKRQEHKTSKLRKASSKTFNFLFTKLLFGFDYDSQSGLKVFKKKVIKSVSLTPTPWSFDLEFIVRALEKDFKILNYAIPFHERNAGVAKVKLLEVTYELAKASVKLRFNSSSKEVRESYNRSLQFSKHVRGSVTALIITFGFAALLLGFGVQESYALGPNIQPLDLRQSSPRESDIINLQPGPGPSGQTIRPAEPGNTARQALTGIPMRMPNNSTSSAMAVPAPAKPAAPADSAQTVADNKIEPAIAQAAPLNLQGPGAPSFEATYPNYKNPGDQYKVDASKSSPAIVYGSLGAAAALLLALIGAFTQPGRNALGIFKNRLYGIAKYLNA